MRKVNIFNLIFSLFLSISINLKLIIDNDLNYFIKEFHINFLFIIKVFLLGILIYFLLKGIFSLLDLIPLNKKKFVLNKKEIICVFFAIFITSFLFLLFHYPGVFLNDTIFMLYGPMYRGSPVIYGVVMSITFFFLKSFFAPELAIFIMAFGQVVIASIILTYVVVWFNNKVNNRILTIILICYYVFVSIISCYNVSLNKDSLFSLLVVIFFMYIFELIESRGVILSNLKFVLKFIIVSVLISYVRNNGLYVIIVFLLIIIRFMRYRWRLVVVSIIIIIFSFMNIVVLKKLGGIFPKSELYTVPLQQVSYVVKYFPDRLSEYDYSVLAKFIDNPQKNIVKKYEEFTVDGIKYNDVFSQDKFNKYFGDFLILWIRNFPKNISAYSKSYLLNSYHLWSINKIEKEQSFFWRASDYGVEKKYVIHNKVLFPKFVQDIANKYYNIFINYLNPAGCFILLIVINLYAVEKNKRKIIYLSLPLIILWFILMLGSPLSSALRYMAPYIYILPIIILYTFKITRKGDENELFRASKK